MFTPQISSRHLAEFCRRTGSMLRAGVDIRRVFRQEVERSRGHHKVVLRKICDLLDAGESFPEALLAVGPYFPPLVYRICAVGDRTGNLDDVLLELGQHFEQLETTRRAFLRIIARPVLQLCLAIGVIGGVILISGSLQGLDGGQLDILGFGLTGPSGLIQYLLIVGGFAVALGAVISAMRRGLLGGGAVFRLVRRIPYIGETLRDFSLSRFAWSLGLTTNTEMPLKQALTIAMESAGDPSLLKHLPELLRDVEQGQELHQALKRIRYFPFEFLAPLEVGEQTGMVSEACHKLHEQYTESARRGMNACAAAFGYLVWFSIALFIAVMIFRIATGYTSMLQSLIR